VSAGGSCRISHTLVRDNGAGRRPGQWCDTVEVRVADTLGVLAGDSTLVFGTITQASWGDDGNLYVLDGQLSRLAVFGPGLGFERFVGRLGAGPGNSARRQQDQCGRVHGQSRFHIGHSPFR
jgi:hypothetical protein